MAVLAKAAVPSVQVLVAAQPCTILTGVLAFQGTVQALATFQPTFEQVCLLAVALVHLNQQGQSMAICCCPPPLQYLNAELTNSTNCTFKAVALQNEDAAYEAVASGSVHFLLASSGIMLCVEVGATARGAWEALYTVFTCALLRLRDSWQGERLRGGCRSGGSAPHSLA